MLSWIPLIGPIIQGIVSIFTTWQNTTADMYKTGRTADVEESKVSAQIIHDTQDDIGLRILRDAACLPVVVWSMLIGWDTIISQTTWRHWMWHVPPYPASVSYLPYAVLAFLLGNIGLNVWKRK